VTDVMVASAAGQEPHVLVVGARGQDGVAVPGETVDGTLMVVGGDVEHIQFRRLSGKGGKIKLKIKKIFLSRREMSDYTTRMSENIYIDYTL